MSTADKRQREQNSTNFCCFYSISVAKNARYSGISALTPGFFLVHLGSNPSPVFGLTQGRKISNSAQFVLTQKNGTVLGKSLDFDTTQIVKFERLEKKIRLINTKIP